MTCDCKATLLRRAAAIRRNAQELPKETLLRIEAMTQALDYERAAQELIAGQLTDLEREECQEMADKVFEARHSTTCQRHEFRLCNSFLCKVLMRGLSHAHCANCEVWESATPNNP